MVKGKFLLAAMAAALMSMQAALAVPVAAIAMVTEVQGDSAIHGQSGRLKKLDELSTPGTITVAAAAKVVVFYLDGAKEYTLNGPGTFEFSATGLSRSSARGALLIKRQDPAYGKKNLLFKVPATEAGIVLREFLPVSDLGVPADNETVPALDLAFSWEMRPHQGTWQFRIVDLTGKVLDAAGQRSNHATLPESVRLAPDSVYRWEVRWIDRNGDPQSQSRRFRTLDAENESLATRLKPGHDASEATQTLYGLWLRSVGAHRLAKKYLSDSFNPDFLP